MIRRDDFRKLQLEIKSAIDELYETAKKNEKNKNDYILFLARSSYDTEIDKTKFSPWRLDHALEELIDRHRVDFLLQYLNNQYSFQTENSADSKFTLSIELMIYTHLWESKHNLGNFKKIADLCDSKDYDWNVQVPGDSKYRFVKNNIRDIFEKHNLKIYDIFKDCYKSQLRNAFAHSLYHFSLNGHSIVLENYEEPKHPLKGLTFDEWTVIFLKSALIQNFYHNKFSSEIEKLEAGKEYEVVMEFDGEKEIGFLSYDHEKKRFNGRMK
ncbi:hypothetical protein [Winogradskyella sp. SYSU M77433]|uniref:hypothetical protein n=1 Tax=Winogradskyella sp. SYSU M77433 TaxID=3042722 RepID=UPI002480D500|nr:hypothetical protein [Winogradskyella sp. SYSU M77433]MDH7914677.1 hypothetical protein [Winogradskyella sp. SYSU M77433]